MAFLLFFGFEPRFSSDRLGRPQVPLIHSVLFGALAFLLLTLGEFTAGKVNASSIVIGGVSLAFLAGAVFGLAAGLVLHVLSLLPVRAWIPVWLLAGLGAGAGLADQLGAFAAIGGRHDQLGWFALAASAALGLYGAVLGCLLQPSPTRRAGFGAGLPRAFRASLIALALAAALALNFVDRNWFPLTYPVAHRALRWAVVASTFSALWLLFAPVESKPKGRRAIALVGGLLTLIAVPTALSSANEDERKTLDALLGQPISGLSVRLLRTVTDVDIDGYSALLGGGDCAPFNPAVNPGADEIPSNGIDDNCVAGDATSGSRYQLAHLKRPKEPSPVSVVLVTIDTLRADRMSLYGYERSTTPHIDRWARQALRFDRAYSAAPWTALSMSALFRGVYPRRLKWTYVWETSHLRLLRWPYEDKLRRGEKASKVYAAPIEDEHRTLSEWLSWRGMTTAAVVDDGRSQFLETRLRVAGEFDRYRMARVGGRHGGDPAVTRQAKAELKKLAANGPFFLWVHYFGPHDAPRGVKKPRFGQGRSNMYDHSIVDTDKQVGELIKAIAEARDDHDRPIAMMLTSDHGEEFLADHRGHGANLKDTNLHVPLVVQGPGFEPGKTSVVVSLVDLLPTVLTWTDTPHPEGLDGGALQKVSTETPPPERTILAETWRVNRAGKIYDDRVGSIGTDYKLEWILSDQSPQLRRVGRDGFEVDENVIDTVEVPQLSRAVTEYLEHNRRVDVSR